MRFSIVGAVEFRNNVNPLSISACVTENCFYSLCFLTLFIAALPTAIRISSRSVAVEKHDVETQVADLGQGYAIKPGRSRP